MTYSIKVFEFTAAVRGYYHYRKFWKPEYQQVLNRYHEKDNAFDRFAMMACKISNDENLLDIFRWKFQGRPSFLLIEERL